VYTVGDLELDIRTAEVAVAEIGGQSKVERVLSLFACLDRIAREASRLSVAGADLRAEMSRVETVHRALLDKRRIIVRVSRAQGGLRHLRARREPGEDNWWWWLDRGLAEQRRRALERWVWRIVGIAVVLVATVWAYVRFLQPPQAVRQKARYVLNAEAELQGRDYESAASDYRLALELAPNDPELLLMAGLMEEALGRPLEAADRYTAAEALYGSRSLFLAMRSHKYSLLGWYDLALSDAQLAIDADQPVPLAFCALASAYEGQGMTTEAIDAFRQCAELAMENDQDELYVIAAGHMARLLGKQ
jgi:tetratricopeptide (TPR) repeat protein